MGAVYEVHDERTDGRRALKVMLPTMLQDADLRDRFTREARITANIESDHIVRVSDAAIDPATGMPFLIMDLLRGEDLRTALKRRGRLPPREVLTLLGQAALALDKTHAAGIIHRDLKPENLFITQRDDGTPCVKILDFGVAKVVAQSLSTRGTQAVGTPNYMSPEQIQGLSTIGPQSDLYALGHVAYTLLVGEAYWKEESRASETVFPLLQRVLQGAVEPPTERALRRCGLELPPAFDAWFLKAIALSPEQRFERATAAVSALARALHDAGPRPTPAPPTNTPPEILDPTTVPVARVAAPPATSVADPTRATVTTSAVSSDPRPAREPRSRASLAAGGMIGLAALMAVAVLIARRRAVDAPRAPLAEVASVAAFSTTTAEATPVAEVPPQMSAAAPPATTSAAINEPAPKGAAATEQTPSRKPSAQKVSPEKRSEKPAATTTPPTAAPTVDAPRVPATAPSRARPTQD